MKDHTLHIHALPNVLLEFWNSGILEFLGWSPVQHRGTTAISVCFLLIIFFHPHMDAEEQISDPFHKTPIMTEEGKKEIFTGTKKRKKRDILCSPSPSSTYTAPSSLIFKPVRKEIFELAMFPDHPSLPISVIFDVIRKFVYRSFVSFFRKWPLVCKS